MSDRKLPNRDIKGRRAFLRHCLMLGSTPLLSAFNVPVVEGKSPSYNRSSRSPHIKIIGVGDFGIEAVRALTGHIPNEVELLGLDVKLEWCEEHRLSLFSDLRQRTEPHELRWQMETFGGILQSIDTLRDALTDVDRLILAFHAGSDSIRFSVPAIVDLAHARGADVRAIVCLPFSFEGSVRERKAQEILSDISPYLRNVQKIGRGG